MLSSRTALWGGYWLLQEVLILACNAWAISICRTK
jgi:hypothetical protein